MKEIKIIDLLNMIAKGKEIPKKIKYDDRYFEYDELTDNYKHILDCGTSMNWDYIVMNCLNEKVEIIEEDNNKIEKLKLLQFSDLIDMDLDKRIDVIKENRNKINEIIDKINNMEELKNGNDKNY